MKSKKKILVSVLSLAMMFLVGFFVCSQSAVATAPGAWFGPGGNHTPGSGGGGGGGSDCDASSNTYRIDCAGLSWIYYESTEAVADPSAATAINFPSAVYNNFAENNAYIDKTCAEHYNDVGEVGGQNNVHGGFWHFGINGYVSSMVNGGTSGHWQSVQYGYFTSYLPSRLYIVNNSANQVVGGIYKANYRVNSDLSTVEDAFEKAYIAAYGSTEGFSKDLLNGFYAFCYWPGMDETGPSYYVQSNVSALGNVNGGLDYKTTGISQNGTADDAEITVYPEETATVTFSHNIYESGDDAANLDWNIRRIWYKLEDGSAYLAFSNSGEYFTVSVPDGIDGQANPDGLAGETTGQVAGWVNYSDQYKIADDRIYTSDGISYIARDAMDLVFGEEQAGKEYRYCEFLTTKDGDTEKAKSTICAKIKVGEGEGGDPAYYSVSNVSNDRSMGWATTGIVNSPQTASAVQAVIELNEQATITFSHNMYTNEPTDEERICWSVSRPGNGSGYTIVSTDLGPDNGCEPMNTEEAGYYTADERTRTDGSSAFIARDIYTIKFTAEGTYTFCETMTVNGSRITTACSSVKVQRPNSLPLCSSNAGNWGSNYTTSGQIQGNTIKGETSVAMHVRNTRLTRTYAGWQNDVVYAQPSDNVEWIGCYYPGAQALANERIATSDPHPQSFNTLPTATLQSRYLYPWTNQFAVQSVTNSSNGIFQAPNTVIALSGALPRTTLISSSTFKLDVSMSVGDASVRQTNNTYGVRQRNDAGKEYSETISTDGRPYKTQINLANHSWFGYWCCCGCRRCTCSCHRCYYRHLNNFHGYNYASGSAEQRALSDNARLIIPYNFINTASFNISNGPVYAGDSISVSNAQVKVGYRTNEITEARYTTQVDYAEVRLVAYVSDRPADQQTGEQTQYDGSASSTNICDKGWINKKQCMEVNKYNGETTTLNPNGSLNEQVHSGSDLDFNKTYDVFDASAGDYMCFVMAVFPWRSGPENDTNADRTTTAAGTESRWLITAPKCAVIAKKPSVSVTGGNVFTSGKITASFATKHNLYNNGDFVAYNPFNPVTSYYGSWGEEAVISNNTIENFASGAALGKTTRSGSGGYGASASNYSYCQYWAPLTFSNYSSSVAGLCGSDSSPRKSGVARIDSGTVDRAALVDYLAVGDVVAGGEGSDGFGSYVKIASGTEKQILYTTAGSDISVGGYIDANTTRVVKASGTVRITSNITYNNGSYSSMTRIPKAVIYASGDIKIECGVTQVDAILIAGGTVYSCGDLSATSGDMNAATRSQNQLVVNGAIIADKVEFGRTYGNAVGTQSGTSAEVINYDTSAIVWGRSMADAGESDVLTTVYVHELAPRY